MTKILNGFIAQVFKWLPLSSQIISPFSNAKLDYPKPEVKFILFGQLFLNMPKYNIIRIGTLFFH
jgi:hypothetical protein